MGSVLRDIQLFITYAHEDEPYRARLAKHLKLYERRGDITFWHDRLIMPGINWAREIDEAMNRADLIIALVSAAFLASDYCYEEELKVALERHKYRRSRLIPIIVRPVEWLESPLGELQALPFEAKPVSTWNNEDEAWTNVTQGILKAVTGLREQKQAFLNAMPAVLRDYGSKRAQLVADGDSEVTRNISRIERKNPTLWRRLQDLRKEAVTHINMLEENFGELYNLTFSRDSSIGFLMPMMLMNLADKQGSLFSAELDLIRQLEDFKLRPSLFGLRPQTDVTNELLANGKVLIELMKGATGLMKDFKKSALGPVREIGERESGEDFEEV